MRSNHTNERVKEHVRETNFREYLLGRVLDDARQKYDAIFLDTPPSTDVLHILALVACDLVIIPSNMDYLALDGISYILKTIRAIGHYPNMTPPGVVGVVPTLFDHTTKETLHNLHDLQSELGKEKILPPIPRDTRMREASACGKTIWEYAPRSQAAIGYKNLSKVTNSTGNTGGYLHLAEILWEVMGCPSIKATNG